MSVDIYYLQKNRKEAKDNEKHGSAQLGRA